MTKPKTAGVSRNATRKSVGKSSRSMENLQSFKPGPNPRRGRGPAKGAPNAGRPPDQWKAHLRTLVDRAEVLAHIEASLQKGPGDEFFAKALDYATDHGYGRATQPIAHSGSVGLADLLTTQPADRE